MQVLLILIALLTYLLELGGPANLPYDTSLKLRSRCYMDLSGCLLKTRL
jgi:hypothetical protein